MIRELSPVGALRHLGGAGMITENERDSRQEAERDLDALEEEVGDLDNPEAIRRALDAVIPLLDAQELQYNLIRQHPDWQHALLIGNSGAAVVSELPTT